MKLIIAGSREYQTKTPIALIEHILRQSLFEPKIIVCGCASGIDRAGLKWARSKTMRVDFFPAWPYHFEWASRERRMGENISYGAWRTPDTSKARGFERNFRMAGHADALLAIWDGESHGTENMITAMKKAGKPCCIYIGEDAPIQFIPGAIPGGRKDVPSLAVDSTATLVERNPPRPVGRTAIGT